MSQTDCLEWLQKQDPDKWFRVKHVQDGLASEGKGNGTIRGVSHDLMRLTLFNDLEMRGVGTWKHYKEFRFKRKEGVNK